MAATSSIRPLKSTTSANAWRRSGAPRSQNLERAGHVVFLLLAAAALLLLARFGVNGLVLPPAAGWGIGLISATDDLVGPFYSLFGSHPLTDLGAAVVLATAAQLLRMLLTGARLPRLTWPQVQMPVAY